MDDIHRLAHLVSHWVDHNSEHAASYRDWSGKMAAAGRPDLAAELEEIARQTEGMGEAFHRLERLVKE